MGQDHIRCGVIKDKFCRAVSVPTSRVLVRMGFTPNQITLSRLFVLAPIILFFMLQGGYYNFLIGMLIYEFSVILDFIDGDMAKIKGFSRFGGILDGRVDSTMRYLVVIGISLGLHNEMAIILGFFIILGLAVTKELKMYLGEHYPKYGAEPEIIRKTLGELPLFLIGAILNQLFLILVLMCFRANLRWIIIMLSIARDKEK